MASSDGRRSAAAAAVVFPGPIIVGAGPSSLAVAACLRRHGVPSLILERDDCIASLWQRRSYENLRLHLPKQFCQLPYLGFPENFPKYPSKADFITYLETYAANFEIAPRFGQSVSKAEFDPRDGAWTVETHGGASYSSPWLVVATGENAEPAVPKIPGIEKFRGPAIHTADFRSGRPFRDKRVLVVGCGNSGMDVCVDLAGHSAFPHLVVRDSVHILPVEMYGLSTFAVANFLLKWLPVKMVDKFLLKMADWIIGDTEKVGIRRPATGPFELKILTGRSPVLDVGALAGITSGKINVVGGVKEITENGAIFMDGEEKEFDAIIFATGYTSNVPAWLKGSDFFSEDGMPRTPFPKGWKGERGLYTVGFTRRGLAGTSADAVNAAGDIARHWSIK
ncbi:probable indole-3-pyruvate monooxygenase YUCCA4 [Andrographis paniculata]|uniref:probable indole-3-pyruvate monooxygenase YUCCA4 n=1 Tax=Andrographis paniculata TaxID=175694 RepID=UPI0021E79A20|nr:probable indole-3-pyruvate monooxygenase YUCCA4 [Andrographis paniculata]